MKHSPAKVLAEILKLAELTGEPDAASWPTFLSSMPDGDDVSVNCIAIYDTVGMVEGRLLSSGLYLIQYGLMIRLRAAAYEQGWEKGIELQEYIQTINRRDVEIEGETYLVDNLSLTSPFASNGHEPGAKRRELFSMNLFMGFRDLEGA